MKPNNLIVVLFALNYFAPQLALSQTIGGVGGNGSGPSFVVTAKEGIVYYAECKNEVIVPTKVSDCVSADWPTSATPGFSLTSLNANLNRIKLSHVDLTSNLKARLNSIAYSIEGKKAEIEKTVTTPEIPIKQEMDFLKAKLADPNLPESVAAGMRKQLEMAQQSLDNLERRRALLNKSIQEDEGAAKQIETVLLPAAIEKEAKQNHEADLTNDHLDKVIGALSSDTMLLLAKEEPASVEIRKVFPQEKRLNVRLKWHVAGTNRSKNVTYGTQLLSVELLSASAPTYKIDVWGSNSSAVIKGTISITQDAIRLGKIERAALPDSLTKVPNTVATEMELDANWPQVLGLVDTENQLRLYKSWQQIKNLPIPWPYAWVPNPLDIIADRGDQGYQLPYPYYHFSPGPKMGIRVSENQETIKSMIESIWNDANSGRYCPKIRYECQFIPDSQRSHYLRRIVLPGELVEATLSEDKCNYTLPSGNYPEMKERYRCFKTWPNHQNYIAYCSH